jgi:SSS family solute:Na+ symporter
LRRATIIARFPLWSVMRLSPLDLAIVVVYLAGITLFGIGFRRGQRNIRDYFLGGNTAPWWAIAFSIVATETSTLTIIGTPALAFAGNLGFLQLVIGYLIGRIVIVLIFIPRYFRGEFYTAYQLIERRFGERTKSAAAATFLVTRVIAEGVRIAAIALVVSVAFGTGQTTSILIIMALTLIYTFEGGMKAVIWTDVIQLVLYLSGSGVAFFLLLHRIPGGWHEVTQVAAAAGGKLSVFDFTFNLTTKYTFWSGLIGGTFLTMASHGTDQTIVQRLLAARSERESKIALLASGAIILVQFALFLVIGVMLYAWHGAPVIVAGTSYDRVFPEFVVTQMPSGLRGLVIAAIFAVAMSNASGSLNSLAASSVVDFFSLRGKMADERRVLRLSRWMTLVWGALLMVLGTIRWGPVLEAGLTIASITFGILLGLFLLGFFNARATPRGAVIGMLVGLVFMFYVKGYTPLAFTWYVLAGTAATFLAGSLASLLGPAQPAPGEPLPTRTP